MKTRTTLSVAVTAFALTSAAASAAIEFGAAPDGFGVVATVTGTQATPRNASRWFEVADAEAVRTNWANEAITFSTSGLLADSYMLGITAKNDGGPGLPSNYSNFQVDVRVNGELIANRANILASDTEWNTLWIALGDFSGDAEVELVWKNDSYRPGVYDANIAFAGVQFAAANVPAPGAAAVALLAGVAAVRRRR